MTAPSPATREREREKLGRLFTMDEAAVEMRVSRRWLQDFIQDHPYYKFAGRKKLFTNEDINRLIEAMSCRGNSKRRVPEKRSTGTSGGSTSASDWITARELLTNEPPGASSKRGASKLNVVNFPKPTSRSRPPS